MRDHLPLITRALDLHDRLEGADRVLMMDIMERLSSDARNAASIADSLAALKLTRERLQYALFLGADVILWEERTSFSRVLKQADEAIAATTTGENHEP